MNNKQFIGIIDSGFGGTSVLKDIIDLMPNENYIFFADSINAPYGLKSNEEILNLSKNMINTLLNYNLKCLVIACNTISVSCYDNLVKIYKNLQIFDTKPSLYSILTKDLVINEYGINIDTDKTPKFNITKSKKSILILATKATINSQFLKNEIKEYNKFFDITVKIASEFVLFVEQMKINSTECEEYAKSILDKHYDYIVLGCTHFPFVKEILKKYNGDDTIFIETGKTTAKNCYEYLSNNNLINNDTLNIRILDTNIDENRKIAYKTFLRQQKIDFI